MFLLNYRKYDPYSIHLNLVCQSVDLQGWGQGLLQFLGLSSIVDDQSVLVSGTSDLELGLLDLLTVSVQFVVDLNDNVVDV